MFHNIWGCNSNPTLQVSYSSWVLHCWKAIRMPMVGGRCYLLDHQGDCGQTYELLSYIYFKHVQTGYKGSANKSGASYRSSFRFKWRRKAPMPQPKQQNRSKTGVRGGWMCDVNGLLNLIETFSISKHQAKREKNRILHLWILQA